MDSKKVIIGHLFAAITMFIWGTTFISTKILLKVISPIEILFLRFTIGFIVLLLIYPHMLKVKESMSCILLRLAYVALRYTICWRILR